VHRKFQQRLPNEILSTLAAALVEGQIFDIVRALTEVQHATEKQLFHKRIEMQKKLQGKRTTCSKDVFVHVSLFHIDEKRNFDKAYQERICNAATADVLALTASLDGQRKELVARQAADLQKFDAELILQLDQKVKITICCCAMYNIL
jgi:hypothetical protein